MQRKVGDYVVLRRLGVGGMAETFLVERRVDDATTLRFCLKLALADHATDPEMVALFREEARVMSLMSCSRIVKVSDFGEYEGSYYMVQELVEGMDLDQLLRLLPARGERLPLEVALYIFSELMAALEYAHDLCIDGKPQSIVHRDVSPSNVLLGLQGEVKLADFGIARAADRHYRGRTSTGSTKGKIAYMSPEQARCLALDQRSDLFSAGVVLYEMIGGVHPFEAASEVGVLQKLLDAAPAPIEEVAEGVPADVARLVGALLCADPAARPASAHEALAMLTTSFSAFQCQRRTAELVQRHADRRLSAPALVPTRELPPETRVIASEPEAASSAEIRKTTQRPAAPGPARAPTNVQSARSRLLVLMLAGSLLAALLVQGGSRFLAREEPAHSGARDAAVPEGPRRPPPLPEPAPIATEAPIVPAPASAALQDAGSAAQTPAESAPRTKRKRPSGASPPALDMQPAPAVPSRAATAPGRDAVSPAAPASAAPEQGWTRPRTETPSESFF